MIADIPKTHPLPRGTYLMGEFEKTFGVFHRFNPASRSTPLIIVKRAFCLKTPAFCEIAPPRVEIFTLRVEFLQSRLKILTLRVEFLQPGVKICMVGLEFLRLRLNCFSHIGAPLQIRLLTFRIEHTHRLADVFANI